MPRRPHDFYETPPHYVHSLIENSPISVNDYLVEPCVGKGAIRNYFGPHAVTNDIDITVHATFHEDASYSMAWRKMTKCVEAHEANRIKLKLHPRRISTVTNPPFNKALEILRMAINHGPRGIIALLLRLSFLEPVEARRAFLENFPPQQIIVLPRYSFRLNDAGKRQTDSVTCAWMLWDNTKAQDAFESRDRIIIAGARSASDLPASRDES